MMCPVRGTLPAVGFRPAMPQKWAGSRMLAPVSLPMSSGDPPAAMIAAARAARRTAKVEGVVGATVNGVGRLVIQRELGRVGFADDDRTRLAQAADDRCVLTWHESIPPLRTGGGDHAGGIERVLDRDRNA